MDILKRYLAPMSRVQRAAFAARCRTSTNTLRNIAYGQKRAGAALCIAIEQATGGAVTRADLRPDDWPLLWPEYTPPRKSRGRAA
ncbi:helix-turn-helix domain-containing protein [Bordetella hinzii]|uniref:transcriptional regulator n=1 Tax=Bordetella hinzii TaxID=103855 RepID=UPI0013EFDDDD|nr:YdaS family helix-turn-helix protein [Bordetella hinzii]QII84245.1 helix-turn-helix domain-containing protein [Bordetella hinzii]